MNTTNNCFKNILLKYNIKIQYLLIFTLIILMSILSNPANAGLCTVGSVKEVGNWINPDRNTRGITRAIFAEECRNDRKVICVGNICRITYAVKLVYTAKLWGKCTPSDCYWGKVDGVYTSANWLRFFYDHGFAKRTVWAHIWSGGNNWLKLIVDTNFVSPSRRDYRFSAWMRRLLSNYIGTQ